MSIPILVSMKITVQNRIDKVRRDLSVMDITYAQKNSELQTLLDWQSSVLEALTRLEKQAEADEVAELN